MNVEILSRFGIIESWNRARQPARIVQARRQQEPKLLLEMVIGSTECYWSPQPGAQALLSLSFSTAEKLRECPNGIEGVTKTTKSNHSKFEGRNQQ
jgi:hypothetical protein